ncbi:hypothetical protein [Pseudomonas phage PA1C]|uniref:Uncharacterized protein n=1 Tax=Pseudomonas phage vB_PaeM_PS119XW TaxID=2601632 RepID=A0A5C1K8F3_9CAUD|nr:hypothetical protein PP933_gp360 [Pseudomonas phage vB_PaeM_PS119XW]QBX32516.1 hypothetical protein [Pseudomonas phage PA1C]QEM42089.1 hypothetical protein [Pseudomonas phage vB_PaeM_PS119XW]BEG72602.1 hypothetical protein RVBP21_2300 [Pseudomonas phage BRkr]
MTYRVTVRASERIEASALKGRTSYLCAEKDEPLTLLGQIPGTDQFVVSVQDRARPLVFKAREHELKF